MTELEKEIDFSKTYKRRKWQEEAEKIIESSPITVAVTHRGAGKTVLVINAMIKHILKCKLSSPRGYYVAPFRTQAKEIAWDGDTGFKAFLKPLGSMITYNESELRINLPNDAVIRVVGADNEEALRGKYADFVVLDEYQGMNADLLPAIVRPTLLRRTGSRLVLVGTPLGKNQFYEAYEKGQDDNRPEWKSIMKKWTDTDIYTEAELADAKMDAPELFEQEYNCSWDAAIVGAFYGKQIERLLKEDRIIDREYDPMAGPVVAGLDFGLDGTCIWFLQMIDGQPVFIDFEFHEQEDARFTINLLIGKEYIYSYLIFGHDVVKRWAGDKRITVKGQFKKNGFKVISAKKLPLLDAITAGRNLIDRCQITRRCYNKKFKFGRSKLKPLDALALYMPKYNKDEGIAGTKEKEGRATHIGEAMRNLAVGLKNKTGDKFQIMNRHRFAPMGGQSTRIIQSNWNPMNINNRNNK